MKQKPKKQARISLFDRMVERLRKFGMTERKAKEVAKGLVPTVKSAVKAEEKAKETKEAKKQAASPAEMDEDGQDPDDETNTPRVGKAVKVNGHSLRLDLPVVQYQGEKGLSLLRVMHGLSSTATYLVAAVRGAEGIIAIRKLGEDCYNVKFYPNMAHWNYDAANLASAFGAQSHLQRAPYERMHFTAEGVEQLLQKLEKASRKFTIKSVAKRLLALTFSPLTKAFDVLYSHAVRQRVA